MDTGTSSDNMHGMDRLKLLLKGYNSGADPGFLKGGGADL